jgi:serine/threonine-protein kinase RsbT
MPVAPEALGTRVEECLARFLSPITARSTVIYACKRLGVQPSALDTLDEGAILGVFEQAVSLYLSGPDKQSAISAIRGALSSRSAPMEELGPVSIVLRNEGDVTLARATALRIASEVLVKPDAVKVSTVTSELARNILQYAGTGKIEVRHVRRPRQGVEVVASDEGPGIANIEQILAGGYRSATGMGLGLVGSKRLMDHFAVVTVVSKGTIVTAAKYR